MSPPRSLRRRKFSMPNVFKSLFVVALPLLSVACGSSTTSGSQGRAARKAAQGNAAVSAADAADQDMVAGVSQGGSDPPIGLKFRLDTRPVVGMPAQLVLALIPSPGVEISHIHGSLQVAEGLQLQSAHSFDIVSPQHGARLEQPVIVVPQRIGVLSLSATLVIDYDSGSMARTYVIPLIASNSDS
jgi:hypothetical protein